MQYEESAEGKPKKSGSCCTIAIDFDGVLLTPDHGQAAKVQKLIDAGHSVFVYTARPGHLRRETQQVLDTLGLCDLPLIMDKAQYDILVDDKATTTIPQVSEL